MTTVNVTSVTNTVVATDNSGSTTVQVPVTTVVDAISVGPQGPIGPPGPAGLVVDTTAKVNQSVVYYDGGTSTFKADGVWTTDTLSDGGNF